jgi:hypothetical protein
VVAPPTRAPRGQQALGPVRDLQDQAQGIGEAQETGRGQGLKERLPLLRSVDQDVERSQRLPDHARSRGGGSRPEILVVEVGEPAEAGEDDEHLHREEGKGQCRDERAALPGRAPKGQNPCHHRDIEAQVLLREAGQQGQ